MGHGCFAQPAHADPRASRPLASQNAPDKRGDGASWTSLKRSLPMGCVCVGARPFEPRALQDGARVVSSGVFHVLSAATVSLFLGVQRGVPHSPMVAAESHVRLASHQEGRSDQPSHQPGSARVCQIVMDMAGVVHHRLWCAVTLGSYAPGTSCVQLQKPLDFKHRLLHFFCTRCLWCVAV